eukprot:XP_001702775.1 predicted protein [Chlamydomonas reinhardtii]
MAPHAQEGAPVLSIASAAGASSTRASPFGRGAGATPAPAPATSTTTSLGGVTLSVVSDLHLEARPLELDEVIDPELKADVLCLLGDIGDPTTDTYRTFLAQCAARFPTVLLLAGNNEYRNHHSSHNSHSAHGTGAGGAVAGAGSGTSSGGHRRKPSGSVMPPPSLGTVAEGGDGSRSTSTSASATNTATSSLLAATPPSPSFSRAPALAGSSPVAASPFSPRAPARTGGSSKTAASPFSARAPAPAVAAAATASAADKPDGPALPRSSTMAAGIAAGGRSAGPALPRCATLAPSPFKPTAPASSPAATPVVPRKKAAMYGSLPKGLGSGMHHDLPSAGDSGSSATGESGCPYYAPAAVGGCNTAAAAAGGAAAGAGGGAGHGGMGPCVRRRLLLRRSVSLAALPPDAPCPSVTKVLEAAAMAVAATGSWRTDGSSDAEVAGELGAGVEVWYCGHTHYNFDMELAGGVRLASNQFGSQPKPAPGYSRTWQHVLQPTERNAAWQRGGRDTAALSFLSLPGSTSSAALSGSLFGSSAAQGRSLLASPGGSGADTPAGEWRLSTNNNQKRNGVASGDARNPSGAGPANGDWAADLDDLDSDNEGAAAGAGADVRSADGAGTHLGGLDGGGSTGAADAAAVSGCCEVADDVSGGAAASAPRVRISGDAIPAEVLLLVLSGLRDTADCVRAAAVCRHWMSVVALSNELCLMLQYKTTCALTQVAVRFMVLRKGFEYLVEAGDEAAATSPPPAVVAEGLLLWRRLLRCWAVYRRWLEVLVVWLGPLGARVEAERQLAGGAAAHGEAPLAPPHLTNKGLMAFRSQVLTELASVPDDATQPQHLHTAAKMRRCHIVPLKWGVKARRGEPGRRASIRASVSPTPTPVTNARLESSKPYSELRIHPCMSGRGIRALIAKHFRTRTDADVKNIFYSTLRSVKPSTENLALRVYAQQAAAAVNEPRPIRSRSQPLWYNPAGAPIGVGGGANNGGGGAGYATQTPVLLLLSGGAAASPHAAGGASGGGLSSSALYSGSDNNAQQGPLLSYFTMDEDTDFDFEEGEGEAEVFDTRSGELGGLGSSGGGAAAGGQRPPFGGMTPLAAHAASPCTSSMAINGIAASSSSGMPAFGAHAHAGCAADAPAVSQPLPRLLPTNPFSVSAETLAPRAVAVAAPGSAAAAQSLTPSPLHPSAAPQPSPAFTNPFLLQQHGCPPVSPPLSSSSAAFPAPPLGVAGNAPVPNAIARDARLQRTRSTVAAFGSPMRLLGPPIARATSEAAAVVAAAARNAAVHEASQFLSHNHQQQQQQQRSGSGGVTPPAVSGGEGSLGFGYARGGTGDGSSTGAAAGATTGTTGAADAGLTRQARR